VKFAYLSGYYPAMRTIIAAESRDGPARAPLLYRPRKFPHCRFSAARIVIRFPRATSRRLLIRLLANSITTSVGLSRPRERADFLENLD